MKNNKKEEAWMLTPKGFFEAKFGYGKDDMSGLDMLDRILVFMAHTGYNAMIWNIDKREWEWGNVERNKEKKK